MESSCQATLNVKFVLFLSIFDQSMSNLAAYRRVVIRPLGRELFSIKQMTLFEGSKRHNYLQLGCKTHRRNVNHEPKEI